LVANKNFPFFVTFRIASVSLAFFAKTSAPLREKQVAREENSQITQKGQSDYTQKTFTHSIILSFTH
jgi:hypothetical protein